MSGSTVRLASPPAVTREVLGVEVVHGPVPERWDAAYVDERICADPDRYRCEHGPVRMYAEHGNRVVVDAPTPELRSTYDYLVYAVASRVLLWQRRRFALHATLAVSPDGTGVAVAGPSTVGKSTLTMDLTRHGWRIACDDVLEIELGDDRPVARPFERPVHLADRVVLGLGLDPALGRPLPGRSKRVYRLAEPDLRPVALSDLVLLVRGRDPEPRLQVLPGVEALPSIALQGDVRGLCQAEQSRAAYLAWCAGVATGTRTWRLDHALNGTVAPLLVDGLDGLDG